MEMKRSLQITGITSILVAGAVLGIFMANINTNEEMGHASLIQVDLGDQIVKSEYAVIGTVKKVGEPYPVKSEYAPRYFGDVIVTVEEELIGSMDEKEITIRTHPNIEEEADFHVGERALLFLVKSSADNVEGEGVYVVSGMYQGKFEITNGVIKDPKYDELTYSEAELRQQIKSQRG